MGEKEFKLLPPGCIKNLSDKLFEKRKAGAMEVEQIVKSLLTKEKFSDLEKILAFFGQEFIPSRNCHVRKGGLIGLASVAIGLGRNAVNYSDMIITPVLQTFRDNDTRVRYFACEALYNIMKVLQTTTLRYLNDIFEALSLATADPDASVRQVAAHCDRLLRDIVIQSSAIDLNLFIPLFCERIYTSIPFTRQFLVCWLTTLNSIPTLSLLNYLPSLLDGLLRILGDSNSEIRRNCELLLSDFLMEISRQPDSTDVLAMVNTLIVNCRLATAAVATTLQRGGCSATPESLGTNPYFGQSLLSASPERLQQVTTLRWLNAFVDTESLNLLPLIADILSATLPCLIDDRSDCSALEIAIRINEKLMKAVLCAQEADPHSSAPNSSTPPPKTTGPTPTDELDVSAVLRVTYVMFEHSSVLTRLSALRWVEVLVDVFPHSVFDDSAQLLPLLLRFLSDPAPEALRSSISLVGHLCRHPAATRYTGNSPPQQGNVCTHSNEESLSRLVAEVTASSEKVVEANGFCLHFLLDLSNLLLGDRDMLKEKGELIITDLSASLGPRSVYYLMALIVDRLLQPKDAFVVVQLLNRILLTQPSLNEFRNSMRAMNPKEDVVFFEQLYRAWCHNPVALLSLCLLTQNYSHCRLLIKCLGELAVSVEMLVEMDQLIQLIESPVFATLRLHLIDKRYSAALQETLYCLLMCLPQTEAFETLRRRLQCLPSYTLSDSTRESEQLCANPPGTDFDSLLKHFQAVQKRHTECCLNLYPVPESDVSVVHASSPKGDVASPPLAGPSESGTSNNKKMHFSLLSEGSQANSSSTAFLIQALEKLGITVSPPNSQPC
ncbi:hypothetical protein AAHC03_0638 [Spirometra sp. Aus1]